LDGRNAMGLMQTLPGVATSTAPTAVTGARGGPTFSISGSRTNTGAMMLDGTIFTDALANTGQQFPSVDALEEFRVLADNYSAEYGRAAGSVVVAVTKSGTNEYHGDLFEFLRNGDLNARDFFAVNRDTLKRNQFGGVIGGPIQQNRTFFFVDYQGQRQTIGRSVISTVPALLQRQGGAKRILRRCGIRGTHGGMVAIFDARRRPHNGIVTPLAR